MPKNEIPQLIRMDPIERDHQQRLSFNLRTHTHPNNRPVPKLTRTKPLHSDQLIKELLHPLTTASISHQLLMTKPMAFTCWLTPVELEVQLPIPTRVFHLLKMFSRLINRQYFNIKSIRTLMGSRPRLKLLCLEMGYLCLLWRLHAHHFSVHAFLYFNNDDTLAIFNTFAPHQESCACN